jgi:hypothetical protein
VRETADIGGRDSTALLLLLMDGCSIRNQMTANGRAPEAPLCAFGRRKFKLLWATGEGLLFESLQTTGEKGLVL